MSQVQDLIEKLKKKSFTLLSYQEKNEIVDSGKPTPQLNISKQNKSCVRKFNSEIYNKVYWICGSVVSNKLYCWPCLLFLEDYSVWRSPYCGYNDLNNLHAAFSHHENTVSHLYAFIAAKTFGQTRIGTLLNQQRCAAINQHNKEVKKK